MPRNPIHPSLAWIMLTQGKVALDVLRSQYFVTFASLRNQGAGKVAGFHKSKVFTNQIKTVCNRGLDRLSTIFARQCNVITAQKVKQCTQMMNLYNRIYDKETARNMASKLGNNIVKTTKGRPLGFLFGAILFSWEKERIHDEDLQRTVEDMMRTEALADSCRIENPAPRLQNCKNNHLETESTTNLNHTWEMLCERDHFKMWRKPLENTHLYEYKVVGTFHDVTARALFAIQVDLEYRKQWDNLVVSLDMVDRDRDTGSEIVRWVMHYPFPMYSREYLFKRRFKVDHDKKVMVVINRAVDHPAHPISSKHVRVTSYKSDMVITPHSDSFDKDGLDFVLTYYDDPQANIPTSAYNWMASSGVHEFTEKLHSAAKHLTHKDKKPHQYISEGWIERGEKLPM